MAKSQTTIAVLAGGSGTRFWPAGRTSRPKQLLALDGDDPRPLLLGTYERVKSLAAESPWIVAPNALARPVRALIPDLPPDAFIGEPRPRNTAAAVALVAFMAHERAPGQPVVVIPADHHVEPEGAYRQALRAMAARAKQSNSIITLGLAPTRPATGYGYLELGEQTSSRKVGAFHRVESYVEKPDPRQARELVRDGRHLWNGGTFAFRPETFLRELHVQMPETAQLFEGAFQKYGKRGFSGALKRAYDQLPTISVDFGVMEHARDVEVLVAALDWDDLGSWDAVARHRQPDERGNRARGDATLVGANNCIVDVEDGHVALLGVSDLIVVRTGDTVLVARRGRGEDVRQVVDELKRTGREDLVQ